MTGILNVDKPAGMTSALVVGIVKRLLPRGTKIGHAGTLDKFATGVLLLMIGPATKSSERLMGQSKRYEASIKLGATTPTLDPDSAETVVDETGVMSLSREQVEGSLRTFVGTIDQIPPDFSALKIGGRRASDRARAGQTLELKPRAVRIDSIELLEMNLPLIRIQIDCGRGTYVRSIARDLGAALKVGGYLTQLRRTRIGEFDAADAVQLDENLSLAKIDASLRQIA